jgi:hypothetical protein
MGLFGVWLFATGFLSLLALSNDQSPEVGRIIWLSIVISLASFALGLPLALIGDYISPPDPWLDFWLDLKKFKKLLKPPVENEPIQNDGEIWADIWSDNDRGRLGVKGKCMVKFESNHLLLEQPGKDIVLMEPRKVSRTSNLTLLLDTGLLGYGKVVFTFNSASDADTVERQAAKLIELE